MLSGAELLPARGGAYAGRVGSDSGMTFECPSLPSDCCILFRKKMGELQAGTICPEDNEAGTLASPASITILGQRLMRSTSRLVDLRRRQSSLVNVVVSRTRFETHLRRDSQLVLKQQSQNLRALALSYFFSCLCSPFRFTFSLLSRILQSHGGACSIHVCISYP